MNDLRCLRTRMTMGVALCVSLLPIHRTASGQAVSGASELRITPAARSTLPTEVAGITNPRRTATLSTWQPSRIVRLYATEGQMVQEGELLVVLDDGVQRVRAEIAKAEADSLLDIGVARARMLQASADLKRLRRLNTQDSANEQEMRDAETDAETARLLHEVAKFEHEQATREYEHQRLMLERLYDRAPFSGYITDVFVEIGETVTWAEKILRIAELNPLEISIDCPLALAQTVRVGQQVLVRPTDPQWQPRIGKVVLASRVADPGSQTFKAKLVVDNGDAGWKSGLKVLVDFATPVLSENAAIGGASLIHNAAERTTPRESSHRRGSN